MSLEVVVVAIAANAFNYSGTLTGVIWWLLYKISDRCSWLSPLTQLPSIFIRSALLSRNLFTGLSTIGGTLLLDGSKAGDLHNSAGIVGLMNPNFVASFVFLGFVFLLSLCLCLSFDCCISVFLFFMVLFVCVFGFGLQLRTILWRLHVFVVLFLVGLLFSIGVLIRTFVSSIWVRNAYDFAIPAGITITLTSNLPFVSSSYGIAVRCWYTFPEFIIKIWTSIISVRVLESLIMILIVDYLVSK